jgi:hypothetical protein
MQPKPATVVAQVLSADMWTVTTRLSQFDLALALGVAGAILIRTRVEAMRA